MTDHFRMLLASAGVAALALAAPAAMAASPVTDLNDNGTGGAVITSSGPIAAGAGIGINVSGTNSFTITPGGSISGGAGIQAIVTGSGSSTINSAFDITGTSAGIATSTVNGANTVNITGGTILSSGGYGVIAQSTGTGAVTIVQTGGSIGTAAAPDGAGIAVTTGAGAIAVTANNVFSNLSQAINATSFAAATVTVTTTPGVVSTAGNTFAIVAQSVLPGAKVVVDNGGATSAASSIGVIGAASPAISGGTLTIINESTGSIFSTLSAPETRIAIFTPSSSATITNNGVITGTLLLDNFANTITNNAGGVWNVSGVNALGTATTTINNAGTINTGAQGAAVFGSTGTLVFNNNGALNVLGATTVIPNFTNAAAGRITIGAGQTFTVGTGSGIINNLGSVTVGAGSVLAANLVQGATGVFNVNAGSGTYSQAAPFTNNAGASVNVNSGTFAETGAFANAGSINVAAGAALTTASLATSSGGSLGGGGTLNANTSIASGAAITGGTAAAPSSALTINGNLNLQAGSTDNLIVSDTVANSIKVSGNATLAGGASLNVLSATTLANSYTVLTAGSITGSFTGVTATGLPAGFTSSISNNATTATLKLTGVLAAPGGVGNQQNVAAALNSYFNNGGTLPPAFTSIFGLTGAPLGATLTQLSGEPGAAVVEDGNTSITPFLDAMLGRLAGLASGDVRPAQAVDGVKLWGGLFGGHRSASGSAGAGSHDSHSDAFGLTGGADLDVDDATIAGASLAVGRINSGLAQNLGSSGSTAVSLGGYARHRFDDAYVSGALSYGWQSIKSRRGVAVGGTASTLGASFDANDLGGRVEGGWLWDRGTALQLTPYAGLQWDEFDTPAYQETAQAGGAATYALAYAAHAAIRSHVELGTHYAQDFAADTGAFRLTGRVAWQHNFQTSEQIQASFLALPGAGFTVNGAGLDQNLGLISTGLSYEQGDGISYGAKVDAAIGDRTQSVFGTATIGYSF